jgi:hypothetical protein
MGTVLGRRLLLAVAAHMACASGSGGVDPVEAPAAAAAVRVGVDAGQRVGTVAAIHNLTEGPVQPRAVESVRRRLVYYSSVVVLHIKYLTLRGRL